MSRPSRGAVANVALVAALLAIGAATLVPQPGRGNESPWWQVSGFQGDGADLLANILLFLPLGTALRWRDVPRRRALLLVLCLTITVELLQRFVIPGRQGSLGDVLTNTLGGALGWSTGRALARAFGERRLAPRLAVALAVAWTTATAAATWLLQPAGPVESVFGVCGPPPNATPCFPGSLLGDGELQAPDGTWRPITRALSARVGAGSAIRARVVDGGWAPLSALVTGVETPDTRQGVLVLRQRGQDLLLFARSHGDALGLWTPVVIARGVFVAPGDTLALAGGAGGRERWVSFGERRIAVTYGPADAWRALYPWTGPSRATLAVVGALYHAAVLFLLGYWGSAIGHPARRVALLLGTPLLALGGIALALGTPPAGAGTAAACAAGLLAGAALARVVAPGVSLQA